MNRVDLAKRILALPPNEREEATKLAAEYLAKTKPDKSRRVPTIIEALQDPKLLGASPEFQDLRPWSNWIVCLSAIYGLPLTKSQVEVFKKHTKRTKYAPPKGGYKEVAIIVGVQCGKSRIASAIATYEGIINDRPGLCSLVLGQDMRGGTRTMFSYCEEFFDNSTHLTSRALSRTANVIDMGNTTIEVYPCRPKSLRGRRAVCIILDEFAFYISTDSSQTDKEMLRAVRGRFATTGGRLIITSSPYGQSGALWELKNTHYGRDDSPVLIWQATAPDMNPTLPADYLNRMKTEDPVAYESEVGGQFRPGVGSAFAPERVDACVVSKRYEIPPTNNSYFAFCDPSGGRVDAFTLGIGHREGEMLVVDVLRAWPSPLSPSGVVSEIADLLRDYGVSEIESDRYAGEWPREAFANVGIACLQSDLPKSDLYLAMIAVVNSRTCELPDNPELLREIKGLERHRGQAGKDKIDHRPGSHDDQANAVAGLLRMLQVRAPQDVRLDPHLSPIVGVPRGFERPSPWAVGGDVDEEEEYRPRRPSGDKLYRS